MGATSKHDQHWNYPKLEFSNEEKKILFAKALEVGTFILFSRHVYQFSSRIFKQKKGGPTGVRATMAASRVVMGIYAWVTIFNYSATRVHGIFVSRGKITGMIRKNFLLFGHFL